ncbi:hypothetical protein GCM10022251_82180 [Phytohabitans flavus]|uniref:Nudix hydrolase domain-containing protein n=1 Tax=Phytohabitans flavus TaxID=1076124 RepID=A0A6F8XL73_9ACTN|nr:NUDIX domain-containing protein [Phytohabitans flavus]BCB74566.1 hypothetical protein Pflav_009760 [Phytohabitans flavus]
MQQPDISDAAHSGRHLTASAVVIDPARRVVLLAVHNVTRLWQFPGGHLEPDESGDEAAIREAREETGIHATLWTRDRLDVPAGVWQPSPIMTIQYVAPANPRWDEPEHLHVDMLYLTTADSLVVPIAQPDEVDDAQWMPIDQLNGPDVRPDIPVIVAAAWQLLQPRRP